MSIVAEFARRMHEGAPSAAPPGMEGIAYPSKAEALFDIRAVIFDIYGTLVPYGAPPDEEGGKERLLLRAAKRTIEYFGLHESLEKMNPGEPHAKTLNDLYHALIALDHEKSRRRQVQFPEVRVENIWKVIIMMLKRHGYDPAGAQLGTENDVAKCFAFYYQMHSNSRCLYPGVVDALQRLRSKNVRLGIVSNAQFYTPMDLTLFVRDQSEGRLDDYLELFDDELVYFSFEYGIAKPNPAMFRRLYDTLYEYHILPRQTVFVGNDLVVDIGAAAEAGMKTALFTGDRHSTFVHDQEGKIVPDLTFDHFAELDRIVSFHEEGAGQ